MLGGVIIHPDLPQVIPLKPEPTRSVRVDGEAKNDCERNAAKRFLVHLKADYPHRVFTITEDALSPNAPHIREIRKHGYHFILGVKEGDHAHLFEQVALARQAGRTTEYEVRQGKTLHRFSFVNGVPLNQSNPDLLVNFRVLGNPSRQDAAFQLGDRFYRDPTERHDDYAGWAGTLES